MATKKIINAQGQSTVEFILTFAFGVSLILVVFNTAMSYATGYLVQYATFMSSRVYLTSDDFTASSAGDSNALVFAERRAKENFSKYRLGVFNVPNSSFNINHTNSNSPANYLTVGGFTTFEQGLDPLGKIMGGKKLELVSEAFLGKEPTRNECAARVCFAITGGTNCSGLDITNFDDGC